MARLIRYGWVLSLVSSDFGLLVGDYVRLVMTLGVSKART